MSIIAQKEIPLTKGKFAIVDDADYEWLSRWKWNVSGHGYAVRNAPRVNGHQSKISMHAQIIGRKPGLETDHINGDRLDNRRSNLRHATRAQNMQNQKRTRGTSLYKGVCWHKLAQKWQAAAHKNAVEHYAGLFTSEAEAALAYNELALKLFGEYARLNQIAEAIL